ncbi:Hypothetical_protein [Hexamita inflata]|uniref:Hypothetical_protein n=1 Tax=Hexamita inflata TaxID=28002 RepID=A0ABP1GDT8_9EUKA
MLENSLAKNICRCVLVDFLVQFFIYQRAKTLFCYLQRKPSLVEANDEYIEFASKTTNNQKTRVQWSAVACKQICGCHYNLAFAFTAEHMCLNVQFNILSCPKFKQCNQYINYNCIIYNI